MAAGPLWDVDRSSGTTHDDGARALDPREWARLDGTNPLTWVWFGRLFTDPAFKSAHRQRWTELAATTFSPASIHAAIDRLAAEVRRGPEPPLRPLARDGPRGRRPRQRNHGS